jgi:multiple sugar transport system permease protein
LFYLIVLVVLLYILAPVAWMFLSTIVYETDFVRMSSNLEVPKSVNFDYYQAILFPWLPTKVEYGVWGGSWFLLDSVADTTIVAVATAALTLVLGSLAAYPLARIRFPKRYGVLTFLVVVQMIPGLAILIPTFIIMRTLNLIDTFPGYILPLATFFAPFVAWMMVGFFQSTPVELEDQALVDGCSRWGTLVRIVLPLVAPGLVASAVWAFLSSWGEFMFAIVLTGSQVTPVSVVVALAVGEVQARWGWMCAQAIIALLPPVVLAVLLQKYLVKGLTAGAIKG